MFRPWLTNIQNPPKNIDYFQNGQIETYSESIEDLDLHLSDVSFYVQNLYLGFIKTEN